MELLSYLLFHSCHAACCAHASLGTGYVVRVVAVLELHHAAAYVYARVVLVVPTLTVPSRAGCRLQSLAA